MKQFSGVYKDGASKPPPPQQQQYQNMALLSAETRLLQPLHQPNHNNTINPAEPRAPPKQSSLVAGKGAGSIASSSSSTIGTNFITSTTYKSQPISSSGDPQPMEYEMTRLDGERLPPSTKHSYHYNSSEQAANAFNNNSNTNTSGSGSGVGFKQLFSRLKLASRERSKQSVDNSNSSYSYTNNNSNNNSNGSTALHPMIIVPSADNSDSQFVDYCPKPDPLTLLESLKSTRLRKHQWQSPVVEDELFVAILLLDGDVDQLKQAGLASQINIAHSHTSINLQQAHSPTDDDEKPLDEMMEQIHLTARLDGGKTNQPVIHSILSSGGNLRAPLLPKRQMKADPPAGQGQKLGKDPGGGRIKPLLKFNSCTTLFTIDNTLFRPSQAPEYLEVTLKAVAHAIMSHMDRTYLMFTEMQRFDRQHQLREAECYAQRVIRTREYFSERLYPVWKVRVFPERVMEHPEIIQSPTFEEIFLFLKQLFSAMDLSAEVSIIMLIYLERLIVRTGLTLHGVNCFRAIIGALLLASKIWDDQAVWSDDMRNIMPDLNTHDLNTLERWWLRKIDFDVGVRRALFARYWFEIREVAERNWGVRLSHMRVVLRSGTEPAASLLDLSAYRSGEGGGGGADRNITGQLQSSVPKKSHSMSPAQFTAVEQQSTSSSGGGGSGKLIVPSLGLFSKRPMTEDELKQISSAVVTSQAKLRQSFTESLSAGPIENLLGSSHFNWESLSQLSAAQRNIPKHQSLSHIGALVGSGSNNNLRVYSASEFNAVIQQQQQHQHQHQQQHHNNQRRQSKGPNGSTNSHSSNLVPSVGSVYTSAHSMQSSKSSNSRNQNYHQSTLPSSSTMELQETVASSFNKDVTDFGWGGSKLRRAKSDDSFKPSVPLASVL